MSRDEPTGCACLGEPKPENRPALAVAFAAAAVWLGALAIACLAVVAVVRQIQAC